MIFGSKEDFYNGRGTKTSIGIVTPFRAYLVRAMPFSRFIRHAGSHQTYSLRSQGLHGCPYSRYSYTPYYHSLILEKRKNKEEKETQLRKARIADRTVRTHGHLGRTDFSGHRHNPKPI